MFGVKKRINPADLLLRFSSPEKMVKTFQPDQKTIRQKLEGWKAMMEVGKKKPEPVALKKK